MTLAALFSAFKAFWSVLVASALIWSGVDLASIPAGNNAPVSDAIDSGELRALVQGVGAQNGNAALNSNGPSSSPLPVQNDIIPEYFDANADYRILTRYGSPAEVALTDFLAEGVSEVTFSLASCDDARADYYSSVAVEPGKLQLESNTLGHVHGTNTETETVCTVTATGESGSQSQQFQLYTVSDRTPAALPPGALTVVQARTGELDIQVDMPGSSPGYLRLGWRVGGGQPAFAVAHGVDDDTVLTISGLQADASYEIRAYVMTAQAFDLYRAANTGPAGSLIAEGNPDSKWIANLAGSGLGKSQSVSQATLPPPTPEPLPTQAPETILPPTPRPTPDEDEEDDDDPTQDTPTPTDNDGTDSDGIDTPTPTDNDGTDSDGIDTPTPTDNDGNDSDGIDTPTPTDNDGTDSDGIDTPPPRTALTATVSTLPPPRTTTATDSDGIDTPTPTDNDGTDSDV